MSCIKDEMSSRHKERFVKHLRDFSQTSFVLSQSDTRISLVYNTVKINDNKFHETVPMTLYAVIIGLPGLRILRNYALTFDLSEKNEI